MRKLTPNPMYRHPEYCTPALRPDIKLRVLRSAILEAGPELMDYQRMETVDLVAAAQAHIDRLGFTGLGTITDKATALAALLGISGGRAR